MRLCYKGTWIEADPQWYWEGSRQVWEARVFLDEETADGLLQREVTAPGKFYTEEAAFKAGLEYAKDLVDTAEKMHPN